MWTWVTAFLQASFHTTPIANEAPYWAKLGAFATIGFGAIGCLSGGVLADRFGRTSLTIGAMLMLKTQNGGKSLLALYNS